MRGQPEQQIDLRIAAQVLSYMVESGMPVTSIEIDDLKNNPRRAISGLPRASTAKNSALRERIW